jgi:hypothetical protein
VPGYRSDNRIEHGRIHSVDCAVMMGQAPPGPPEAFHVPGSRATSPIPRFNARGRRDL